MNLNTLKRGFTKTNPEKGLRSLTGSQKSERRDSSPETIRVSGKYIPSGYHKTGRFLGFLCYGTAWLCNLLIILSLLQIYLPIKSGLGNLDSFRFCYIILGLVLHFMTIFSDGLQNSDAPWSRKSILVFWGGFGLFLTIYIPLFIIMSIL